MWDQVTIGYLAGLFDGEGTIDVASNRSVKMRVTSTDYDIVERAYNMSGIGTIRGPYIQHNRPNDKPIWIWSINKQKEMARLCCAIAPLMSVRRREKFLAAAEYWSKRTIKPKNCVECSEEYTPAGHQWLSKYCSSVCRQVAAYRRRKEAT